MIHNNPDTITFNDFMESIGIRNHINFTTHTSHHTLDLVLTDGNDRLVSRVDRGHYLSDHCFVDMIIKAGIDPPPAKQITYRKLKNIDLSNFNIDVLHEVNELGTMPLDQQVDHYNNTLKEILDRHAPEQTKTLRVSHQQPWFTDKIKQEIVLRRAKERKWLNDPTEYNLNSFYIQCRQVANIIKSAQKEYYIEKITENRTDYRAIFNIAKCPTV